MENNDIEMQKGCVLLLPFLFLGLILGTCYYQLSKTSTPKQETIMDTLKIHRKIVIDDSRGYFETGYMLIIEKP